MVDKRACQPGGEKKLQRPDNSITHKGSNVLHKAPNYHLQLIQPVRPCKDEQHDYLLFIFGIAEIVFFSEKQLDIHLLMDSCHLF